MFPVLFEIGGFQVTSFGVMMALSFVVGGWITARELKRKGHDPEHAWDLAGYAAICGILGAKLYYMVLHWPETAADPWGALTSRAGLVWYGSLIGGAAGVLWRLHRLKLPILTFGDAIAPAIAMAYAIGRVGCFLVGDDWGRPTSLPWGVAFPEGAPPTTAQNLREFGVDVPASISGDTVMAVHPTQLYETAMSLVIFAILWRLRHRFTNPGTILFLWLALSGVERFIVEFFRAKDDRFLGPFSIAQVISVLLVAIGVAGMQFIARRAAGAQPAPGGVATA